MAAKTCFFAHKLCSTCVGNQLTPTGEQPNTSMAVDGQVLDKTKNSHLNGGDQHGKAEGPTWKNRPLGGPEGTPEGQFFHAAQSLFHS